LTILPRFFLIDGLTVAGIIVSIIAKDEGKAVAFSIATSVQSTFFIIVSSLGLVFFPDLSKTLNDKSLPVMAFWNKLGYYLRSAMYLGFFVSIVSIFATPLVLKLFEILGKGSSNQSYILALIQISSFRLFFQSIKEILDKYFYAKEKRLQPMILSILGVVSQIVLLFFGLWLGLDAGILSMLVLMIYYATWSLFATIFVRQDYTKAIKNPSTSTESTKIDKAPQTL
jgi:peptidoglycan biosynthesis protein MviN/MurJ (putative lipid II flippase)